MANRGIASDIAWIEPEELACKPTMNGYRYWNALRGGRRWPRREELSPRNIPSLLSYMALVKVLDGGADFEHRIVGDVMVRAFKVPIQHRKFSDIAHDAPELSAHVTRIFHQILSTGLPVAWRQRSGRDFTQVVFTDSETILLPLGDGDIDHVLGFGSYHTSVGKPSHL